jgi:multiple sugar transport system substrate-binding protein
LNGGKKMKRLAVVLMVLFLAGSLFAGGGSQPSGSSSSSGGVTHIVMWNWDNNVTDITFPAFESTHPNIKIDRVVVPAEEIPLKLQQSLAAGLDMPDILLAEINARAQAFSLDIWEDLGQSPYNIKKDIFFESTVGLMQNSKGQIVAIDQTLCPSGIAYKRGLTKQYFGTDDRAALENIFKSLDDFVAKGAEVARASGGKVFMFAAPADVLGWIRLSTTTKLVNPDGSINYTGKARDSLDFLIKLRNAGAVDAINMWSPQENASFAGDNHIFYPLPNWGIQFRIKTNDPNGSGRWGVMIPPTGGFSWGGTVQGIYKNSKHKAEAWEYLKWFSFSKEGTEVVKKGTDYFTPVKEFYNDPSYVSNVDPYFGGVDTGAYFYKELMPKVVPPEFTPYDAYMNEVDNALAAYIMADRTVTLQQALAKGIEELKSRVSVAVK